MYDPKYIREDPEGFDAGLARRGVAGMAADILALDDTARALTVEMNAAQARRNAASKAMGAAKAKGDDGEFERLYAEVDALKGTLKALEGREKTAREARAALIAVLPNAPAPDVPEGIDESANVEVRRWGAPREIDGARHHFDLGASLGMDFETAAAMSGARFVLLRGQIARLERALGQFMLDLHTREFGYEEINPPLLVRDEALFGVGQLPKFAEDLFIISNIAGRSEGLDQALASTHAQLSLIPTAEAALTNIVREKILGADELPLRFTALTACFRSEAGSAGRDTRGMIRLHQFMKVELVSITTPEGSDAEHERMTNCAEEVLKRLDLPFRTMLLCAGDMGFSARKTYDLEVWLPGQQQYREISSCSNCGAFQARRMKARFRREGEKQAQPVHTLNGSGLAVGRTLVAVMENYQQADGSIAVPDVLQPYMDGARRIEA